MSSIQPLPRLFLLTDARNDASLANAIARLPEDSAVVFRHYHLDPEARRARFDEISAIARERRLCVILSDSIERAEEWGADGVYGEADRIGTSGSLLRIATAHDEAEIAAANGVQADGVMLSPVLVTRSHPGAPSLGPERFRELAGLAVMPAIALGGMTAARARELGCERWAAIDGLS